MSGLRYSALISLLLVVASLVGCDSHPAPPRPPPGSRITHLAAARHAPGAYGRAGDLVLESKPFGVLTFATSPDAPGHKPIRGALVDVGVDGEDRTDPLLSWRPAWRGADGSLHVGPMDSVDEIDCQGARGVHVGGDIDAVRVDTSVCPTDSGYRATTSARGLPDGASLADEVNLGASQALAEGTAARWDGERASAFFGASEGKIGWLIEAPQMRVIGHHVRVGEQWFQGLVTLRYPGTLALRTFRVIAGDALDLLDQVAGPARRVHVAIDGQPGSVAVLDQDGRPLANGAFAATGRELTIPAGVGAALALYDVDGVEAGRATIDASLDSLVRKPPPRAEISFRYVDGTGAALPVHVIFRGLGGTPDPAPVASAGTFAGGRSLYLVDGTGAVALPPGRYRVTASHGPRFTLATEEVLVHAGDAPLVKGTLRDVFPLAEWTAGDFHLHAAPSPDSPVTLDARVASLVCEGIDLAVATDHNRMTDYGPSVDRLGARSRIVTVIGDEITSYGKHLWGHFNAYPLAVTADAPEAAALPYYDLEPAEILRAAHEGGVQGERIVQVNHARMAPSIGYFDLVHLDAKTGRADASFSDAFEALEVFNGFSITTPADVRAGAVDLVALARRGLRVAATGNSDSHHLLYEEAGYPRTYVHVARDPIATRKDRVLDAIRRRDTTVSSGPLVELTVDGAPIGSVVVPNAWHFVRAHVRVTAPAWVPVEHVEIWHDDTVAFRAEVTRPAVDGVRFETDVPLAFPVDGTVLAWATADTPLPDVLPYANARSIGFTGLVYVDANGDGKVEPPPRAPPL